MSGSVAFFFCLIRLWPSFARGRPAFGKRVLVEFERGNYYPGTINTEGDSVKDRNHSKGRWGVLFDDCTRDRFFDGAADGEFFLDEEILYE